MAKLLLLCAVTLLFFAVLTSTRLSAGTALSEELTILSDTAIINVYLPVIDITLQGCRSIVHINPAFPTDKFLPGDKVLIIQMQGAEITTTNTASYGAITNMNNAGNFEVATVYSVDHNNIALEGILLSSFSMQGKVQIIRIPQYATVALTSTVSCLQWDGMIGGVVMLIADSVTLGADIDVSSRGFRGGIAESVPTVPSYQVPDYISITNPSFCAHKGEGIAGFGQEPFTSGRGAPANGGGGGNNHNAGGGGGANVTCAGNGGWAYNGNGMYSGDKTAAQGLGGYALSVSSRRVFMGGGGGAGHGNTNQQSQVRASDGGNGGGIIIIIANYLRGNSYTLRANGTTSENTEADGAGGGGAGGSILLAVQNYGDNLHVEARGGDGGNVTTGGVGPGGGGSGGFIHTSSSKYPTILISDIAAGRGGTTRGEIYGATNGCAGRKDTNLVIPENRLVAFTITALPDSIVCPGESVQLDVQTSKSGNMSYLWQPSGSLSDSLSATPIAWPKETTSYIVTVTDSSGCSALDTVKIVVLQYPSVTVVSLPDTTAKPGTNDIALPVTITLPGSNQVADFFTSLRFTITYDAYVFNLESISGGEIISKEIDGNTHRVSVLIPLTADSMYKSAFIPAYVIGDVLLSAEGRTAFDIEQVAFMPAGHCSDIASINGHLQAVDYCKGYNLRRFERPIISTYPNPVSDAVVLTASQPLSSLLQAELINPLGNVVKQCSSSIVNTMRTEHQTVFSFSGINNGMYFLRFVCSEETYIIPLIIHH